ncbi:type II secretion system secretin GspD [Robiginitomaculum antarcticum]|uniref:type II secretion system secretin GspD n=1 Tax=Robiginitomaculum antarcticum TaxID=437507 RepID=UPI0003A88D91|nr:type II secretion system secretin GspD [Robiginitomaculum antarcticum]
MYAILIVLAAALVLSPFARAQDGHLITMQEADIRAFIDDVSIVTGKTFLVDPRVQGKVTISSEQNLSKAEVFEVFKDVMRLHGYAVIRTPGGEYRITLLQGAAQDAPYVVNSGYNGQLATTIIRLNYVDAAEAAKLIKPVMHSQGVLTALPNGNIIVVTDFPENLRKAREIVNAMDTSGMVVETVQLTQISPMDAEAAINKLAGPRAAYRAIAVPGTNSIILEGNFADIARIRPIILQMDQIGAVPRGQVTVIPLRFADGEQIAGILAALLPSYAREGQPVPTVAYEAGSNTIIISASGETQQALSTVIRRLDVRRPQVLVEAIIVEVSDTATRDLGLQFAIAGARGNSVPFIGTNYSRQAPNILSLTGAIATAGAPDAANPNIPAAALSSLFGLEGGILGGAGISGNTLFSVILNAVETDDNSNVLSTPFVTTVDNVPATFLVGQEIPITTGESLGANNVNPFRTFERQEVGIKLEVLPQISEGDVIRLTIAQEVSSINGAVTGSSADFILNKREITTTVLANDGEVIVLGGLIQDDEEINIDKVPGLGDAPIIGRLFQSRGKARTRTNLMVFLRPTIIRSAEDARPITRERMEYMRRYEIENSEDGTSKLDRVMPQ